MSAYTNYLNGLTNHNRLQYPEFSNQIKWIGYDEAAEKEKEREFIFNKLENKLHRSFKNTKLWINSLSKGCELCGAGEWSCLFVTGKCNGSCFYCPTSQNDDGVPSTQLTRFENPDDYVQYLDYFGFKGASLSGGEPLIVFDRTLNYIQTIKQSFGDKIYLWMYTNGILGSKEIYKQLAKAGINEVRFDIGASNYNLKYLKLAQGIIPNLTVEIPAVPEDIETLKNLIPELIESGVTNLNLHQLRLTNYNAPKLLKREYTYLHGEQATVLESELTALKIIEFVADHDLKIGVNYCAFNFKNRFQKAGYRRKIATKFIDLNSQLTENGYLRTIKDLSTPYFIENNKIITQDNKLADSNNYEISYNGLTLDDHEENEQYLKKIRIGNKTYFLRSGLAEDRIELDAEQMNNFVKLFESKGVHIPEDKTLFSIWKKEFIEWNLREYF